MSNFVAKLAAVATMGVAVLPWIALSVAHAEPATVRISDLNLSQPEQVAVLDARIDRAADQLCAGYATPRELALSAACRKAVRAEAKDKVAAAEHEAGEAKIAALTVASR
jgi:UrcA family protein